MLGQGALELGGSLCTKGVVNDWFDFVFSLCFIR